ncbi:hypothetical protein D3C72_2019130 [compost metagenome]
MRRTVASVKALAGRSLLLASYRPLPRSHRPFSLRLIPQPRDDPLRRLFRRVGRGVDAQLGPFRRLVRRIDAGEVLQLATPRLLVQALGIALLGQGQRGIDEDLQEGA